MFAVVKTGGKQYCVKPGDVIKIEKLEGEPSDKISLDEVLLTSDDKKVNVGEPFIKGASVVCEILKHVRNDKIIVFKKKRRHNYRRKAGHKQWMSVLKVTEISLTK